MKARTISFERGQDPKDAMNIGLNYKKKFLSYFPNSSSMLNTDDMKGIEMVKDIVMHRSTKISYVKYDDRNGTLTITIAPSKTNWFFFTFITEMLINKISSNNNIYFSRRKLTKNSLVLWVADFQKR